MVNFLGQKGEDLAEKYFKNRGCEILTKNFHSRFGEIDLIIKDRDQIVFVEVKTRKSNSFGTPEESISRLKLQKIIKTALYFLNSSRKNCYTGWRIDSIGILLSAENKLLKFKHLKNITNG